MVPLARKNLFDDVPRFLVALAGIVFAVSLLVVQTGMFNGFVASTSLLIEESRADIWLAARQMPFLEVTLPLPYADLAKAHSISGVARAEPMIIRTVLWRSPHDVLNPGRVVGFDPNGVLFSPGKFDRTTLLQLRRPYTFFADSAQLPTLDLRGIGERGSIGTLGARLIDVTHGTQPVISPTFLYTSLETANAYTPSALSFFTPSNATSPTPLSGTDSISYILIQAANPSNVGALQKTLERTFPATRALTRQEMMDRTRSYWVQRTSIGFTLSLIALMGIIVGVVVAGQILYTSVNEHLREFGTLKAIGATDAFLYRVIVGQSLYMAVLGYFPSLLVGVAIAQVAAHRGVTILITPWNAMLVLALTVAMCVGAGVLAMHRVTRVDPAIVFKA